MEIPTVPPPAPPPEEHVPEIRGRSISGDGDLRPILCGSCENERD